MHISADMHTHTIASTHAYSTILENANYAKSIGLKALAITDHTQGMPDSPHIWHFHNLRALPRILNGVEIIKGAEVNVVDYDGTLDLLENELKPLEWIIASMHKYCIEPTTVEAHTNAYIQLSKNPYIDVIGHPTTDTFLFDFEKGLRAFKEYDKLVEINESSIMNKRGSAKNTVEILKLCKRLEVPIIINSDAHFCQLVGETPIALKMLSDLDFPENLVANAEWEPLKARISKKHPNIFK